MRGLLLVFCCFYLAYGQAESWYGAKGYVSLGINYSPFNKMKIYHANEYDKFRYKENKWSCNAQAGLKVGLRHAFNLSVEFYQVKANSGRVYFVFEDGDFQQMVKVNCFDIGILVRRFLGPKFNLTGPYLSYGMKMTLGHVNKDVRKENYIYSYYKNLIENRNDLNGEQYDYKTLDSPRIIGGGLFHQAFGWVIHWNKKWYVDASIHLNIPFQYLGEEDLSYVLKRIRHKSFINFQINIGRNFR